MRPILTCIVVLSFMLSVIGALNIQIAPNTNLTTYPDYNERFYYDKTMTIYCKLIGSDGGTPDITTTGGNMTVYENGSIITGMASNMGIYELNSTFRTRNYYNYSFNCTFTHTFTGTLYCPSQQLSCNTTHITYRGKFIVNSDRYVFDDSVFIFYNLYGYIIIPFFALCMTAFVFRGNVGTTLLAFSVVSPLFYIMFNNPAFVILGIGCVMVGLVFKYFNI